MRRYISALALALAVALGSITSGATANAAGIATAAITQAPAKASTAEQVRYKRQSRPRAYSSYGAPRYYGCYSKKHQRR